MASAHAIRPPRHNPAWTGVEHNDFGIDEFFACAALSALNR